MESISRKDIVELWKRMNDFFTELNIGIQSERREYEKLSVYLHRAKADNFFGRFVSDKLCNWENDNLNNSYQELIKALYKYNKAISYSSALSEIYQKMVDNHFLYRIKELKNARNPILWVLYPKSKKLSVQSQYEFLLSFMEDPQYKRGNGLINDIDSLEKVSGEFVENDFRINRGSYFELIKQKPSFSFLKQQTIPVIDALIEEINRALKNLNILKKAKDNDKEKILQAIDAVKEGIIQPGLSQTPLDYLYFEGRRRIIRCLQRDEYTTVGSVYNATIDDLLDVDGIGNVSAYSVKEAVDKFVKSLKADATIRLSIDDKNPDTTALLKCLYCHFVRIDYADEIQNLEKNISKLKEQDLPQLVNSNDGFSLFFASDDEVESVKKIYQMKKNNMAEYSREIENILFVNRSIDNGNVSDSVVWKDFEENPIKYNKLLEDYLDEDDYDGVSAIYHSDNVINRFVSDSTDNISSMQMKDDDIRRQILIRNDTYHRDSMNGELLVPLIPKRGISAKDIPEEIIKKIDKTEIHLDGFRGSLRKYQTWGVKFILSQKNTLLGDEMGLGKTVEAIATMVSMTHDGGTHFLVVCPMSVITNWCREIKKFSALEPYILRGEDASTNIYRWLKYGGVGVVNYESLHNVKKISSVYGSLLVVDEAHYIKNRSAMRTQNVIKIMPRFDSHLFMTGTALENKVDEMINLVSLLSPSIANGVQTYATKKESTNFCKNLAAIYLRRKRSDVLKELPEKVESNEWCTLEGEEKEAYEEDIMNSDYSHARRLSFNIKNLQNSSKGKRLVEIVNDAADENRKVLVFSYFLDTLQAVKQLVGNRCIGVIDGSVSTDERQHIIDQFNNALGGSVLVCQISTGGTGLNIQSASVVIICEPQFKPSTENQAISRSYRMGQARKVLVYHLLAKDTIEEGIIELLESKRRLFDAYADKSAIGDEMLKIDEDSFKSLAQKEKNRIILERSR